MKLVADYFSAEDIRVGELQENVLAGRFDFEGGAITIFLEFDDTDTHVYIRGGDFLSLPRDKYDLIYKVINECNRTYPHEKFVLDEENGEILVRDDAIIQLDSCGPECLELVMRMVFVVENVYPKFMKALWA